MNRSHAFRHIFLSHLRALGSLRVHESRGDLVPSTSTTKLLHQLAHPTDEQVARVLRISAPLGITNYLVGAIDDHAPRPQLINLCLTLLDERSPGWWVSRPSVYDSRQMAKVTSEDYYCTLLDRIPGFAWRFMRDVPNFQTPNEAVQDHVMSRLARATPDSALSATLFADRYDGAEAALPSLDDFCKLLTALSP
jgi:hypothetical protein